ncbi:MAG TPA: FkbM family methyltransferase [Isosphaeraceae bacterium]|nr:FkbM family methyltransferase [Isosphaeraceae bacterium]
MIFDKIKYAIGSELIRLFWPVRVRGKARVLGALAPSSGRREGRVFGYPMTLDLADYMQRMMYLGAYEREETRIISGWLKPGMTFVDVGANVGYFTLLASRRVGAGGRVIAIEPSPIVHERLAEVVASNGLAAEVHRIGLSDENGTCTLFLPPAEVGNHSPTMVRYEGSGSEVSVPVRRLDDCLDEWGVAAVDLLKIDVEGHEPAVFRGASRALASGRIKAILCEFNDFWLRQSGTTPQAAHELLTGLGFVDQGGPPVLGPGCVENRFFVHQSPAEDAPEVLAEHRQASLQGQSPALPPSS